MKIILAVDKNWGIGKDGKMLYHIASDLKHFKATTLNNICIMGRKTYESMGGGLLARENIVLSKNPKYKISDGVVFSNPADVVSYVKRSSKEAFVIGGEKIVEIFLPYCDEAIITKINGKKEADTFLHNFDSDEDWEIYDKSDTFTEDGVSFEYVRYRRVK
ncbi:dihydrofolate reductase [uncultured Anaerococcus sp.]|uniref:dihydrofolate reductase n=1 Tax=uncultured Anaerococcus sp. TaxID=293428 RepID=UPI00288BDA02|nr:dihydrofolate reductase [uncultured Anaerococcus sp.]